MAVNLGDALGERIRDRTGTGQGVAAGVEGGTGDFQQLTRPFDVVAALLLRLDERVHVHRVSRTKKAFLDSKSQGNALGRGSVAEALAGAVVQSGGQGDRSGSAGGGGPLPYQATTTEA
ncbi:hypothetical protein [Microtetraspora malaysiensis]|uniref:Uncharacterized protein n=1 Tax=Microtetraspora malaysiensis TaxID=161358 RepID=A0ABW6T417_9ACTN